MTYEINIQNAQQLIDMAGGEDKMKFISGEYKGPCPVCGGTDRFRINPSHGTYGKWYCRGCNPEGGDTVELYKKMHGCSFRSAASALRLVNNNATLRHKLRNVPYKRNNFRKEETDTKISMVSPLRKTKHSFTLLDKKSSAAKYLRTRRGIDVDAITDGEKIDLYIRPEQSEELIYVRWLCGNMRGGWFYKGIDNGGKVERWLPGTSEIVVDGKQTAQPAGGCFNICDLDNEEIGVCEGVENALSIMEMNGFIKADTKRIKHYGMEKYAYIPVAPCGSCHRMAVFEPPDHCRKVFIFKDPGSPGGDSARELAYRLRNICDTEIVEPPTVKNRRVDWNDYLRHYKGLI